jgi:ATP-dependent HslUV protease ATP-binding subunit HslU
VFTWPGIASNAWFCSQVQGQAGPQFHVALRVAHALFLSPQVEATKYTELGYVGRDVEDMIKDLVEASISSTKQRLREALASHAEAATEDILIKAIVGEVGTDGFRDSFRWVVR